MSSSTSIFFWLDGPGLICEYRCMNDAIAIENYEGWTTDQCERGEHDFIDCILGDGRACSNCDTTDPDGANVAILVWTFLPRKNEQTHR